MLLETTANPGGSPANHDPWGGRSKAAHGTLSPSTERALRSDWKIFATWCAERGLEALPASPETAAAFVDAMAKTRASATVRRYIASIAAAHRAEGREDTVRAEPVRQALKRMHRKQGRRQAQARGLNWPLMERMLAAGGDSLTEARNRALLAAAYDTLLRRSELVALRVEDVIVERDGSGTALVRRSKTDSEGYGAQAWIAPDSMTLVQAWLERSAVREGAMFRALRNGVVGGALGASEVPRIFREMAQNAGLPPSMVSDISAHSTRIGAAQDMVAEGIGLGAIMQAGRWASESSVMHYAERMLARRNGAAQLARIQRRV